MTTNRESMLLLGRAPRPFASLRSRALVTREAVRKAFDDPQRRLWLAARSSALSLLPLATKPRTNRHRLLVLQSPSAPRRELLSSLFHVVVAPSKDVQLLPEAEVAAVLGEEHPEDFFIGGVVDHEDKALLLYRGSLDRLVVPFSWFRASGIKRPDFDDFEIIDGGQTVRLGQFEAAADAILFEFDPEVRSRLKAGEIQGDDSFGGALRRLRLARGVAREDFEGIAAKTIARIERNEVKKPRGKTLERIASTLRVEPEEIETF